jgi:hypothetical protein
MSWCSDAPEDEAISLFAGLLANPDVPLSLDGRISRLLCLLLSGQRSKVTDSYLYEAADVYCGPVQPGAHPDGPGQNKRAMVW